MIQNIVVVQKENCDSWSVWYLARPSSTVIGWLGKKWQWWGQPVRSIREIESHKIVGFFYTSFQNSWLCSQLDVDEAIVVKLLLVIITVAMVTGHLLVAD